MSDDVVVAVGGNRVIVIRADIHRSIAGGASAIQIGSAPSVEHQVPHHHGPAIAGSCGEHQIVHVSQQAGTQVAAVVPGAYAGFREDELLRGSLIVDVCQL